MFSRWGEGRFRNLWKRPFVFVSSWTFRIVLGLQGANMTFMPRNLFVIVLAVIGLSIVCGLAAVWPQLRKDLSSGLEAKSSAVVPPEEKIPVINALVGVEVMLPAGYELGFGRGGVLIRQEESPESVLVAPLRLERTMTCAAALSEVGRSWNFGLERLGHRAQLGIVHDEGAIARAGLDIDASGEKLSGEVRVCRQGEALRLEAFWCRKDLFDRERAALDLMGQCVKLGRPRPLPVEVGKRFACAVPYDFEMREESGGLEVCARANSRLAFGLAVGTCGSGLSDLSSILDGYLTHSKGLSNPTTISSEIYPTLSDAKGRTWSVATREITYDLFDEPARAVLTAGVTRDGASSHFLLAVRQAPPADWNDQIFTLTEIEASVRMIGTDKLPPLKLPIVHPAGGGELLMGWEIHHSTKETVPRNVRSSFLDAVELCSLTTRSRLHVPQALAQPDGNFLDPFDPYRLLSR